MLFQQLCENIHNYTKINGRDPRHIELTSNLLAVIAQELHLCNNCDLSSKKIIKKIRECIKAKTGVWVKIKINS